MLTKQKLQSIKILHEKKGRDEEGKFMLEGWKSVEEALNAGIEIETVIYNPQKVENESVLSKLQHYAGEMFPVKPKELEFLSDAVSPQGIIAVLPRFSRTRKITAILQQPSAVVVVLDRLSDPGNLGTIIRTCDWFGVDALVIGQNSVDLYNPKVVRSSMGSMFHIPIIDEVNLNNFLSVCRQDKFTIYSTELDKSVSLRGISFSKKTALIIGSESHGVSPEVSKLADKKVHIPQFGKAESLNAAMACGIFLSHIKL